MQQASSASLAGPLRAGDRYSHIDAVRGLALLGVMIGNGMEQLMSNVAEMASVGISAAADEFFRQVYVEAVRGKARTLFMLMFGFGFGFQLHRLERHGNDGPALFRRRMIVLLMIGLLHQTFISMVDVLHFYAAFGLMLLPFRKAPSGFLLWCGLLLGLFTFPLWRFIHPLLISEQWASWLELVTDSETARREAFIATASYLQFVDMNVAKYMPEHVFDPATLLFGLQLLGVFMLGMWLERTGIVTDKPRLLALCRRWWLRLLVAAVVLILARKGLIQVYRELEGPWRMLAATSANTLFIANWFVLAAVYVMLFLLAMETAVMGRVSTAFAAVGRMALTNYVLQSFVFLFVFYGPGLGLINAIGPAWLYALVAVTFIVQMVLSTWWLQHFTYGPLEWLWRSLTYRKAQPFRPVRGEQVPAAS